MKSYANKVKSEKKTLSSATSANLINSGVFQHTLNDVDYGRVIDKTRENCMKMSACTF